VDGHRYSNARSGSSRPARIAAAEIRARLAVGVRVVSLQRELAQRVGQLEQAPSEVDGKGGVP